MLETSLYLLLGLAILIAIDVPIAVSICAVALTGLFVSKGDIGLFDAALKMYDGATSFPLIAIPLFIFMGIMLQRSKIAVKNENESHPKVTQRS